MAKDIDKKELKRGNILAEDVISNGVVIVDKDAVANFYRINDCILAEDVSQVSIQEIEPVEPGENDNGNFGKIDPVDAIIEKLYTADLDYDNELEVLKDVKALTKKHTENTIEGLDLVINYFDHAQARKIAAEGILNIGYREYFEIATVALLDEDVTVRKAINKFFLKFKEDIEVISFVAKHKKYVNSTNEPEYKEVFQKMFNKLFVEKAKKQADDNQDTELSEYLSQIIEDYLG